MNKRIRKKIFKRACKKIENGQELTSLERRVYTETIQSYIKSTMVRIPQMLQEVKKSCEELGKN